jgi:hypothetical protein
MVDSSSGFSGEGVTGSSARQILLSYLVKTRNQKRITHLIFEICRASKLLLLFFILFYYSEKVVNRKMTQRIHVLN